MVDFLDEEDELTAGLEKAAGPASYQGPIQDVWRIEGMDDGTPTLMRNDPFSGLKSQIENHVQEGDQIEHELTDRAQNLLEMRDMLSSKQANYEPEGDPEEVAWHRGYEAGFNREENKREEHGSSSPAYHDGYSTGEKEADEMSGKKEASFEKTAPPKNVKDTEKWRKAEEIVKKEKGKGYKPDSDYALVNHIYQNEGGTFGQKYVPAMVLQEDVWNKAVESIDLLSESPRNRWTALKHLYASMGGEFKEIRAFIEKSGDEWLVKSKDGSKTLGRHSSRESAEKQLKAIEVNKHGSKTASRQKQADQWYGWGVNGLEKDAHDQMDPSDDGYDINHALGAESAGGDPTVELTQMMDDLKQQIDQHNQEGQVLEDELDQQTNELINQISTFKEGSLHNQRVARINRVLSIADPETSLSDMERVMANELRVTEPKKGMEVVTPNGPGEIVDLWDGDTQSKVRLSETNEIRSFPVSRLTKAASFVTYDQLRAEAAAWDQAHVTDEDLEFSEVDDSTPGTASVVSSAIAGELI